MYMGAFKDNTMHCLDPLGTCNLATMTYMGTMAYMAYMEDPDTGCRVQGSSWYREVGGLLTVSARRVSMANCCASKCATLPTRASTCTRDYHMLPGAPTRAAAARVQAPREIHVNLLGTGVAADAPPESDV